jgi:glycosyltransferase involved in cell wall biosynthesis
MNCKDLILDEYTPPKNKIFTVSYIGILHKNRMFPEIVDIVGNINNIRFIIAGQKENLYEFVKKRSKNYSNINFLGTIPIEEVITTTLKSDAVICMINPIDLNDKIALPNKLFEAMVCARPIITTNRTYSGKFTKQLNCGLVIDYNEESLKQAILELKNNKSLCEKLGTNGLKEAEKNYNWDNQKKKLLILYNSFNNI